METDEKATEDKEEEQEEQEEQEEVTIKNGNFLMKNDNKRESEWVFLNLLN